MLLCNNIGRSGSIIGMCMTSTLSFYSSAILRCQGRGIRICTIQSTAHNNYSHPACTSTHTHYGTCLTCCNQSATHYHCTLLISRRFIGPRQYLPQGIRQSASRVPMTFEMGENFNELAKIAYATHNYGDAIGLFDRALTTRRTKYGPIHVQCAATLHNIGRVFFDMKEYGAAENAFTEAAAIYQQLQGPRSIKYAQSLSQLARTYTFLKFIPQAQKAFKDSIRIFRDVCYNHAQKTWLPHDANDAGLPPQGSSILQHPQKSPLASAAHALADCATLFITQNELHQAITFFQQALQIRRYLYSRHVQFKPIIAQTLNKLCEVRKSIGDAVGAQLAIDECLKICKETLGREHAATAAATSSKGNLCLAKGKFRDALQCYEQSAGTYRVMLGKDSPQFAQELVKIGRVQELLNDFTNAQKNYRAGCSALEKCHGPDHLSVAEANAYLGSLLIRTLQIDKGVEVIREAVRVYKKLQKNHFQLPNLYQKLGEAYAIKQSSYAQAYFLLAIDGFKENVKVDASHNSYITDTLDDLGLFYLDFQHFDKAEKCFRQALNLRISLFGQIHPTIAYSYSNFCLLHVHKKQYVQCQKMGEAALDMYLKTAPHNTLAHADVHTALGQACHQQRKFAEALKWHEKALNIRRTHGDGSATATAESLNHLARVHLSQKHYATALQYVKEAHRIVSNYNLQIVQRLQSEIEKTLQMIPSEDTWPEEERDRIDLALNVHKTVT